MSKTPTSESSKRNEILAAALALFLENGYEKTSVRMISQKVGCEVGLVYYYFKTKIILFAIVQITSLFLSKIITPLAFRTVCAVGTHFHKVCME